MRAQLGMQDSRGMHETLHTVLEELRSVRESLNQRDKYTEALQLRLDNLESTGPKKVAHEDLNQSGTHAEVLQQRLDNLRATRSKEFALVAAAQQEAATAQMEADTARIQ